MKVSFLVLVHFFFWGGQTCQAFSDSRTIWKILISPSSNGNREKHTGSSSVQRERFGFMLHLSKLGELGISDDLTYDACSAYVLYPIFTTDVAVDGEENPSEVARSSEVISMVPGDDAYCELRSFSSLYDILFYLVLSNISLDFDYHQKNATFIPLLIDLT